MYGRDNPILASKSFKKKRHEAGFIEWKEKLHVLNINAVDKMIEHLIAVGSPTERYKVWLLLSITSPRQSKVKPWLKETLLEKNMKTTWWNTLHIIDQFSKLPQQGYGCRYERFGRIIHLVYWKKQSIENSEKWYHTTL